MYVIYVQNVTVSQTVYSGFPGRDSSLPHRQYCVFCVENERTERLIPILTLCVASGASSIGVDFQVSVTSSCTFTQKTFFPLETDMNE